MSKRAKTADEMTRRELEAVRDGADLPMVDDDRTLEAAGLDPKTREPRETIEQEDQRLRREEEIAEAEAMTVEDWDIKIREERAQERGEREL